MTGPRISGEFQPRVVGDETLWVSADGVWVLVSRPALDRLLGAGGTPLDPMGQTYQDLGLVMGTGVEASAGAGTYPPPADVAVALKPTPEDAPTPPKGTVGRAPLPSTPPAAAEAAPLYRRPVVVVVFMFVLWAILMVFSLLCTGLFAWTVAAGAKGPSADVLDAPPVLTPVHVPDRPQAVRQPVVEPPVDVPQVAVDVDMDGVPAWQVHLDRGWNYLEDQPSEAVAAFQRVLVLYPFHADAYRGLGEARLSLGDRVGGVVALCEARRLDASLSAQVNAVLEAYNASCEPPAAR